MKPIALKQPKMSQVRNMVICKAVSFLLRIPRQLQTAPYVLNIVIKNNNFREKILYLRKFGVFMSD